MGGDFDLHEVEEATNPEVEPAFLLPDLTAEMIARNAAWLAPRYYDPATGFFTIVVRSWLIRMGGRNVLIDTCCGNDKPRPYFPPADNLQTPYLERLHAAGCAPEDIDLVMCTHLHVDHCGWNTRLLDGRWVPTFPNARYVFSQAEYDAWAAEGEDGRPLVAQRDVFEDSVSPVVEAGLAEIVDGVFSPLAGLTIEPAPGHTPGHCLVRAQCGGKSALFIGDAIHHPIQIAEPELNSAFCSDPVMAARTRRRILEECAEHGHVLIPAHFPAPAFGRVQARDGRFVFRADG